MILKPSENIQLYGMDLFFNDIAKLYNQKNMKNRLMKRKNLNRYDKFNLIKRRRV